MSLYLGDSLISQLYVGTAAADTTNITLSKPAISVNSSTGLITSTVTQPNAGYLTAGSNSNTFLYCSIASSILYTSDKMIA